MIDIFTCLWGNKYNRSFVENIKNKIDKHLTIPHRFHCITDNPIKEYDLPVRYNVLKGMFIKMSLFEYTGKCLYFDIFSRPLAGGTQGHQNEAFWMLFGWIFC